MQDLAQQSIFHLGQGVGSCAAIDDAVVEREPQCYLTVGVEHAVVDVRRQQWNHRRDGGAERTDGGNAEGAEVMAANGADRIEPQPEQQPAKGPGHPAHPPGPAIRRDVVERSFLVPANDRVDLVQGPSLRSGHKRIQDDALVVDPAIDAERGDILLVLVEAFPGNRHVGAGSIRERAATMA